MGGVAGRVKRAICDRNNMRLFAFSLPLLREVQDVVLHVGNGKLGSYSDQSNFKVAGDGCWRIRGRGHANIPGTMLGPISRTESYS